MGFSATDKATLNASTDVVDQNLQLGTKIKDVQDNSLYVQKVTIAADATAGQSFTATESFELLDVIVQAKATVSNGTAKVRSSSNDATNAIIMAVDTTITRATNIIAAYSSFTAGSTYNIITANAGDRGIVTLVGRRI